MAESQVVEYCPCCGGVDSFLFRICRCDGSEPTNVELMAELKAIRAANEGLAQMFAAAFGSSGKSKDTLAVIHEGEAIWPRGIDEVGQPLKPSFTPLDSKVLNAVAAAAGISLNRSLGFSLQFREPALVVAVVEYHVSTEAFAAAVDSIRAIPEGKAS